MILQYIANGIPGYWDTLNDINCLLRASKDGLRAAKTVYMRLQPDKDNLDDFVERSKSWQWKVAATFMTLDAELKREKARTTDRRTPELADPDDKVHSWWKGDATKIRRVFSGTVGGAR